jgi:hypothetical protein
MRILILTLVVFAIGCSKDSGGSAPSGNNPKVNVLSANTCVVTRPGGKLDDGSEGATVNLFKEYLSQADQSIYIADGAGKFPNNYTIHRQFTSPTKNELLQHSLAYKWEIGPAQDSNGKWTQLTVWKEILYSGDNEVYFVDQKFYSYGDPISFTDADANLNIQCNIPAN